MPSRTLPGLELEGFAPYQENNWNDWMDPNLLKLSVLVQLSVQSRTTVLPGAPGAGDKYIVPTAETNGDSVAVFDDGEWVYYPPKPGMLAWVEDVSQWRYWTGTEWVLLSTGGGGIPDAPIDGGLYARRDGAWESFVPGGGSALMGMVEVAGTTHTVSLSVDGANPFLYTTNGSETTITLPANATEAIPIGWSVSVKQQGAGAFVFAPDTGVTLHARGSALTSAGQYAVATAVKTATDVWTVTGDLEA